MFDLARLKRVLDPLRQAGRDRAAAWNPLDRLAKIGAAAGGDSNPLFDALWYARRYPDALRAGQSAYQSYLAGGAALGHDPGPLFDTRWYLSKNPDIAAAGIDPVAHYLAHGMRELRDPSPVFDSQWYFAHYPEARASGLDARAHYMAEGHRLGHSPSPFFDTAWYREAYPEIAATGENPLLHYLLQDVGQGYNPGPYFDTQTYLAHNPECERSGKHPLVYFLLDEEMRRQASLKSERSDEVRPSREAIREIDALVDRFGDMEVAFEGLAGETALLPVQIYVNDEIVQRWRALYLSLFVVPRLIVLIGSIDNTLELASLAAAAGDLLIVETDSETAALGDNLPRNAPWRSLAEFGPPLDLESRVRLVTALVNNLQPSGVLVWGSRAGWEMLARHGRALRSNTALFATTAAMGDEEADPVTAHFRSALPSLTALYGGDAEPIARLADRFGLPRSQRGLFQPLENWNQPGGFLSSRRAAP